ncbi:MAG: hypothetical protein ABIV06_11020 [Thermoanaerobaculia bacterium]
MTGRADRVSRGETPLSSAERERLERDLTAAIEEAAPAFHASAEVLRAGEALATLHLASRSELIASDLEADDTTIP